MTASIDMHADAQAAIRLPEDTVPASLAGTPPTRLMLLEPHETLFFEGDENEAAYEIVSGLICLTTVTVDGRRQLLGLRFPGDVVGLSQADEYECGAVAVGPTRVRRFARATLDREIARDPKLAMRLVAAACEEVRQSRRQLLTVGRKCALERVATFLDEMRRRTSDDRRSVRIELSRTDIGDLLGLSIETVSRCFTRLRKMGVIDLPTHDLAIVRDVATLRALADGDADAIAA